ncbi:hypothetical protein [Ottowia sp.]|uniref:hypothetical protein n=1 Tax=Ottowia sp. TaxID=1898956 RepID=UPI0025CE28B8|nr:hypothetical protein [Ottowia sp.]MBK6613700.1 hypothetical protein [Ottowia sp.]
MAACREEGIPDTPDYNAGSYEGVRYLEQTAWRGRRWKAPPWRTPHPVRSRAIVVRTGAGDAAFCWTAPVHRRRI